MKQLLFYMRKSSVMKRQFILITTLLLSAIAWSQNQRSLSEIKQIACDVLNNHSVPTSDIKGQTPRKVNKAKVEEVSIVNQLDAITVVAQSDNGFVIVSNDERCEPVVGYSFKSYNTAMPDGFQWWLNAVNQTYSKNRPQTHSEVPSQYSPSVSPLLITQWGQSTPFNEKCPYLASGAFDEVSRSITGCVATSLAQVLYYYRYPLQGSGSYTYDGGTFDYGNTVFEWGNMLPSYSAGSYSTDQANAVATLMYACGVAVDMNYGVYSSGAVFSKIVTALNNYFGYGDNVELIQRSDYNDDWMNRIYSELHHGRPVLYAGTANSQDAAFQNDRSHAFVIDGYDTDGLVHVNWGWDGDYDGYFSIDALNPFPTSDNGYNDDQTMIVNIKDYIPHPNLIAKSVVVSGEKAIGEKLSLTFRINNTGTDFNGKFYLFVSTEGWKESSPIQTEDVSLNTDEEKTFTFSFTPVTAGSYYLWVSSDAEGKDIIAAATFKISELHGNIEFADPQVKKLCVMNWDSNGDGELSYAEAADVKELNGVLQKGFIKSFDEFQYFTGITTITGSDFWFDKSLESIILPNSIEIIEADAFKYCKFESITIPENVKLIGANPFVFCSYLTEINVSPNNKYYTSEDGILFNIDKTKIIAFPCGKQQSDYIIPNTVTTLDGGVFQGNEYLENIEITEHVDYIGSSAIADCKSLKSLVIPDNVHRINCNAFPNNENLESVWIGKGVRFINNNLFGGCTKLTKIDVDPQNEYYCSVDGILMSKDQKTLYQYPPGREGAIYEIPYGVSVFGSAFSGCKFLETIIIPESITDIDIIFLKSSITSINIPQWITIIPTDAFRWSHRLSCVTIPNSVKSIGKAAFIDTNISEIYSYIENPMVIEAYTFDDECYQNATLYVPAGKVDSYKSTEGWNLFKHIVEIPISDEELVTISAHSKTIAYGDEVPILTYDIVGGRLNGTPKLSTTATRTSLPGTYPIKVERGTETNRQVTYMDATLTITKAPLTIAAQSYSIASGNIEKLPEFKLVYSGFKNGETEAVLTTMPTVTCEATKDSPSGRYAITVSGAMADNYDISYVEGTLTIEAPYISASGAYFNFYTNDDGTAVITDGKPDSDGLLEIPGELQVEDMTGTIPVVQIDDGAFQYNSRIRVLIIPESIQFIGIGAFFKCKKLEDIYVYGLTPPIIANVAAVSNVMNNTYMTVLAFEAIDMDNCVLHVPYGTAELYRQAYGWREFTHIVEIVPIAVSDIAIDKVGFDVYDMSGRRVRRQATTLRDLPKGVYIVGGRKRVF